MPTTYIESGTVASESEGASVAPTIDPVAKITAEFAPVSACAAASRTTLALTRASLAISSLAVISIMSASESRPLSGLAFCGGTMERRAPAINRRKRGRGMRLASAARGAREHQDQVVAGHLDGLAQGEAIAGGERLDIGDVAHAPFGIFLAQPRVEHGIGDRRVMAPALERAIEVEPAIVAEIVRGAREQAFGGAPWRDVDHIGAEHGEQLLRAGAVGHLAAPGRVGQIDHQRLADVVEACLRTPRQNAFEIRHAIIARPPGDAGRLAGEMHHMLPGAAAGLQYGAGFALQEPLQHRPDRRVVTVE